MSFAQWVIQSKFRLSSTIVFPLLICLLLCVLTGAKDGPKYRTRGNQQGNCPGLCSWLVVPTRDPNVSQPWMFDYLNSTCENLPFCGCKTININPPTGVPEGSVFFTDCSAPYNIGPLCEGKRCIYRLNAQTGVWTLIQSECPQGCTCPPPNISPYYSNPDWPTPILTGYIVVDGQVIIDPDPWLVDTYCRQ
jgi:hypothetical protein